MMTGNVIGLLKKMTPEEQAEVETFAAFVLTRRKSKKQKILTNDIPTQELMSLVEDASGFDWLASDEEDVYSMEDGEAVAWAVTS